MPELILVRHARPAIDPSQPGHSWHLSRDGRRAAAAFAARLLPYRPEVLATSHEPKARETADIFARAAHRPVQVVNGLQEHNRENVSFTDSATFTAGVLSLFAQPQTHVFGLETADQAHTRFNSGIEQLLLEHPGKPIAVFTHGTVLSLFVARRAQVDGASLWRLLTMPAAAVLSLPSFHLSALLLHNDT